MRRISYLFVLIIFTLFVLLVPSLLLSQQNESKNLKNSNDLLPMDPTVMCGKLENGITYYIRENKKPEKRAELRLAVKAGSINEDEDQQGLAHFCEHMAFNGTKNFPKQEIVNYLESIGMKFGPEVNAYTSYDQTIYMIQVPTDKDETVNKGLLVLFEWASNIAFDPVEVDKERGVILEEERLGRGAEERMRKKQWPVLFKDSKYAVRNPIGKREIIEKFEYNTLTRFYQDWYHPENQAIIAVGDFDKNKMLELIKEIFSKIPVKTSPRPNLVSPIPDHKEILFAIASDKEASYSSIGVICKHDPKSFKTIEDYRKVLMVRIANGMLSQRISEITQRPDAPFAYGGASKNRFVRSKEVFQLAAYYIKNNQIEKSLDILLSELEKVKRFGYTESELKRFKTIMLNGVEKQFNERDKTESARYASEYIDNFTAGDPTMGITYVYEFLKKYLDGITLVDVNKTAKEMLRDDNTVIMVNLPEKEGVKISTEKDLTGVIEAIKKKEITAYDDKVLNQPLLEKEPAPVKIKTEKQVKDLNVTEWILGNGVKVILKPTDFKNDEILFQAFSPGGTSLVSDSDYYSAALSSQIVNQCGIGKFNSITLRKYLAGKIVSVYPYIGELNEGIRGSCAVKDMETMFQMIYLYFTDPNKNKDGYLALMAQFEAQLENMKASPQSALNDTISVTIGQYNYRRQPFSKSMLNKIDFETAFKTFKDRFADASDFTFLFIGNFDIEKIKPMIEKYIGGLPSINRVENWKDLKIYPPAGSIDKKVFKGIEDKSTVFIYYNSPFEWSRQNKYNLESLNQLLDIKLRENIREEKGGTYGVGVQGAPQHYPREWASFTISFGCKPSRVDELVKTVFDVIDSVKNYPVSEQNLTKIKELQKRSYETNSKLNNWWLGSLAEYYMNNEDPVNILDYIKLIDALQSQQIQEAAKKYLDSNCVKIVLYPEKK